MPLPISQGLFQYDLINHFAILGVSNRCRTGGDSQALLKNRL
jgi:hypothetical protein